MKTSLLFVLSAACLTPRVHAQTKNPPIAPVVSSPAQTPQQALKSAQELMDVDVLWNKQLDWKESKASPTEIVSHVRQALGNEAPDIEVRTNESPLTTFTLKGAPLGQTLSSVASLANAKLWALPGRLLIAPPTALTAEENDLVSQGMGGEWKQRTNKWDAIKQLENATVVLVGAEVKKRFLATGAPLPPLLFPNAPTNDPRFLPIRKPYEIAVKELSTASQLLLSDLLNARGRMLGYPLPKTAEFEPSVTVSFNDTTGNTGDLVLWKPEPGLLNNRRTIGSWHAPYSPSLTK